MLWGNQPGGCNSTLWLLSVGRNLPASSRDNPAFWLHMVLTSSAKTQSSLQSPCFSAKVFVRSLVLQILDLQRSLFFLFGTSKGKKKPLNGKKDQVAALWAPCLLLADWATLLGARFHNYTVLAHNYPQLSWLYKCTTIIWKIALSNTQRGKDGPEVNLKGVAGRGSPWTPAPCLRGGARLPGSLPGLPFPPTSNKSFSNLRGLLAFQVIPIYPLYHFC